MSVVPAQADFSGVQLTESVRPIAGSNTCPASIQEYTDFPTVEPSGSSFVVGANVLRWEGQRYDSVYNSFYDSHRVEANFDVLGAAGVNQCTAQASQVYYCQGQPIANFILTNAYTHGTLDGQGVTNVTTTKQ